MKKYILCILATLIISGCTEISQPSSTSREVITYWWWAWIVPSEIDVNISLYSSGTDWWAPNRKHWWWWFPDYQGFPMELILQDQLHALLASPYIDRDTKDTIFEGNKNPEPNNPKTIQSIEALELSGSTNQILWVGITSTYPFSISPWYAPGGMSLSGVPDDKQSSLSYPLILPTEITYFYSDLNTPINDANKSPYRSNRIMQKINTTWSATGIIERADTNDGYTSTIPQKSILRNWIQEGEVTTLDTIRVRIFPTGYAEDLILPLVHISLFDMSKASITEHYDIFAEKNGKIVRKITNGQLVSWEWWSESGVSDNAGSLSEGMLILKNIANKNIDTIIFKKRQ